jgi:hypothetical protein
MMRRIGSPIFASLACGETKPRFCSSRSTHNAASQARRSSLTSKTTLRRSWRSAPLRSAIGHLQALAFLREEHMHLTLGTLREIEKWPQLEAMRSDAAMQEVLDQVRMRLSPKST